MLAACCCCCRCCCCENCRCRCRAWSCRAWSCRLLQTGVVWHSGCAFSGHAVPKEHAGKIVTLMSEYCLCQRIKPVSDPKTPFSSEAGREIRNPRWPVAPLCHTVDHESTQLQRCDTATLNNLRHLVSCRVHATSCKTLQADYIAALQAHHQVRFSLGFALPRHAYRGKSCNKFCKYSPAKYTRKVQPLAQICRAMWQHAASCGNRWARR